MNEAASRTSRTSRSFSTLSIAGGWKHPKKQGGIKKAKLRELRELCEADCRDRRERYMGVSGISDTDCLKGKGSYRRCNRSALSFR